MDIKPSELIRYLRLKEGLKQELLAKKIGMSKSNFSLIENDKRNLSAKDFLDILDILGAEIIIKKDEKDCVKMMNNEIIKNNFRLTDIGYCKDYLDLNGNPIRVEFNTYDANVLIARDMNNTNRFLSEKEFNEYELKYSDKEGYGLFWTEYMEKSQYWECIFKTVDNTLILNETIAKSIFSNEVLSEIKADFLKINK